MSKVKTFRQPRNQDESRYLEPIINPNSSFFCCACLEGKPKDDQSADLRYCLNCFDFLTYEASLLGERDKRPSWVPTAHTKLKINRVKAPIPTTPLPQIMATVNGKKSEVAIIQPRTSKRGPKHRELPVELIIQWASEGMGSKRIAARLEAEHGIKVGFRTIARVIAGQRVLV